MLADDVAVLARSPLTIHYAFDLCVTGKCRTFTVAQLKKKLANSFRKPFQTAVQQMLADQRLPDGIGWVQTARSLTLFRREDVYPIAWRERLGAGSVPAADSPDDLNHLPARVAENSHAMRKPFADSFAAAFDRLDRQRGSVNLVNLVELRRELDQFTREEFDAELRKLRLLGRFSLSGAESLGPIDPAEIAAAIRENGSVLMQVSRRTS